MHARRALGAVIAAAAILPACAGGVGVDVARLAPSPSAAPSPLLPIDPGTQPVAAVVERVGPAVVNVRTNLASEGFGGGGQGTGTGFIVRERGVVVTNFHVVDGAFSIDVFTAGGDRYPARVIGGDPNADLAVLQVEAGGLPTVELGDSDALRLGESVVALGFALGLEGGPSVTAGIVSQVGRTITAGAPGAPSNTLEDLIQTDAAINPGNSGGPLVDLAGRVVGINTAAAQAAENIGFAIAINRARPIIEDSIENPEAAAAYLGVSTGDVDAVTALQLGLEVDEGALVIDVAPGSAAAQAGIRPRDVIVGIAGEPISGSEDVSDALRPLEPGDAVEVTVVRDGEPVTLEATLGARPLPTG